MFFTIADLVEKSETIKHHALILLNNNFRQQKLSFADFVFITQAFCNISLTNLADEEESWVNAARHPDVFIADRTSNNLQLKEVTPIRARANFPPIYGKRRIFFLDKCERLSLNSGNALLKILEEPPANALFLLTAANINDVLPTIASRCQKIHFVTSGNACTSILNTLEPEDKNWLCTMFNNSQGAVVALHNTPFSVNPKKLSQKCLANILEKSTALSSKFNPQELRDLLVEILANELKNKPEFIYLSRVICKVLSEWKEQENINPSSPLWLSKILMLVNAS